jgi:putative oxidoreductase
MSRAGTLDISRRAAPPSTADAGLLLLRAGLAALLLSLHGWARTIDAYNLVVHHRAWPFVAVVARLGFPAPKVFAVLSAAAESLGALLVGIGLATRIAAFAIAVDMGVAIYSLRHARAGFELPALYLVAAVALVAAGAGRYAVEAGLR